MCYRPNPDEISVEDDFAEMGVMPQNFVRVTPQQQSALRSRVQKILQSPQARGLSPAQKVELRNRLRALFARINPHVQVR